MSSSLLRSSLLRSPLSCQAQRWKHTVRIILMEDLPTGAAYKGDVIHVKAGYARNYLIPQKKALYAIPDNFLRLGRKDPDSESHEERRLRLAQEASDELNEDLKASNLLFKYLKNKTVSIS
jgi:ribosomal protein L9